MFAYCNNNPVKCADYSGGLPAIVIGIGSAIASFVSSLSTAEIVGIGAGMVAGLGLIFTPVETIKKAASTAQNEIYEYSRKIRESISDFTQKMPHVHHIVPVGNFSSRSPGTQAMIAEMHVKLDEAGINRYTDPINLMVVSAGTHATLHTDAYIAHVYSYIKGANGKEGIYEAMYYLRLEIAAWDTIAGGY